ncbi:Protein F21F3.7 [Aphelenchoides avenae]|nr:Protein F21F3.7 [Aphelenchus avenae]
MSMFHGHQRTNSGVQQLIATRSVEEDEEDQACVAPYGDTVDTGAMRFSTLSDCSSYYGLPGAQNENSARFLCKNAYLRANVRVVIGSVALTLAGAALLVFGVLVMTIPNEIDVHGWIFLVVGVLFFIPGFYHVFYIICTLCGRPGYSFDNLPTFTRP